MNGQTLAAIALSLVSAVAYAAAAVAQERLAARTEAGTGLAVLLRRSAWWWSVGLNATGALLHVAALTYGSLTVVQPLGALTLVAAVPLGARRAGRQVSRGEWRGTALTLFGLAAILLAAAGTAPSETLSLTQAVAVAVSAIGLVALLTRTGGRPGLGHAAASGITSGVASALTQTVTVAAAARDGHTLPVWQVAIVALLVAAFASGGLLLSQAAYQGGLGAPLALLTLANPVAAAAIGLTLLGERLQGGALGIAAAGAGAVAAARGVVLLTRSTAPAVPTAAGTPAAGTPAAGSAPAAVETGPAAVETVPADAEPAVPPPARPYRPGDSPRAPAAPGTPGAGAPVAAGGRPQPAAPAPGDRTPAQQRRGAGPPANGARERRRERRGGRRGRRGRVPAGPSGRRGKADQLSRQDTGSTAPVVFGASAWGVPVPVLLLPGAFTVERPDFGYAGPVFGRITLLFHGRGVTAVDEPAAAGQGRRSGA